MQLPEPIAFGELLERHLALTTTPQPAGSPRADALGMFLARTTPTDERSDALSALLQRLTPTRQK